MKVLGAGRDVLMPPNLVEETAAAYKTTAAIVPGAPHDLLLGPNWQDAADAVLQAVEDGLSS